jgi:hypothetical protein
MSNGGEPMPHPGAEHDGFDAARPYVFLNVFADALAALEREPVGHVLVGGLASSILGRPRCTGDIDLMVRPQDARRALAALEKAGFATEETNPHWIFKGWRDGVLVDLLFKGRGDIYVDDEMLARSRVHSFFGQPVRVIPPEDLIVIKALVHDEETPRHWHDALGIIASGGLDWSYLVRRAGKGPRRVLSLLFYAASNDLVISMPAVRLLLERVADGESAPAFAD